MLGKLKEWFDAFTNLKSWVQISVIIILVVLLHHYILH
jgi:hypothetical protein